MTVRRTRAHGATAVAAACLGLLLPALPAVPASAAGPTSIVTIEPLGHQGSGAAGSCLMYRLVPRDAAYEESVTEPGTAFASVTLAEVEESGSTFETQDVDFCTLDEKGDEFKRAPRYFPGGSASTGAPLYYNPGWTLTPEEAGNPQKARQDVPPATTSAPLGRPDKAAQTASTASAGAHNALNLDQAIVAYDRTAGGFVFGVVGLSQGGATISGFLDHNGDGLKTPEVSGVTPGDADAVPARTAFTPGGPPYSLTVADAARTLEATPKSVTAVAGDPAGASLVAAVMNGAGQPLAGVRPRIAAEGGPNAESTTPTWSGSCAASDSSGRAACTYSGKLPGTDQIAVFVNQTAAGATAGRDTGEPFDVAQVTLGDASAGPTATPLPAPSATDSPSASPSASPSVAFASPEASPTEEATTAPPPPCAPVTVSLDRAVITATSSSPVRVTGAPGKGLRLLAYSAPSTTYRVVRETTTDDAGGAFFVVRPLTNTRLYATQDGCPASAEVVLLVRSAVTMAATRVGVRDFVFRGRVLPSRSGQPVSLHRLTADGRQVLVSRTSAGANGIWSLRRAFTGSGRHVFVARTGSDLINAAGVSPARAVDLR